MIRVSYVVVSAVSKLVSKIRYFVIPVVFMLAVVGFAQPAAAEVALLEGQDQAIVPGDQVSYTFYVRNNNRLTETVKVNVETNFEYTLSANNFELNYGDSRQVVVVATAPMEVEERIEEVVTIRFLEISTIDTKSLEYSFLVVVIPPEEIPDEDHDGIPDWKDPDYRDDRYEDDYYDDDFFPEGWSVERLKTLFIQLYLLAIIITIIGLVAAVYIIRSRFLEEFDETLWDVELRPCINTIFQGGYADPKMRWIWTMRNIYSSIGIVLVFWLSLIIMDILFFRDFPIITLMCGTALVFLLIWDPIQAAFYYQNYRFILKKDRIVVHSGIVTRWKTVVPYVRITDVDTIAWFWDRIYGLKTIRINTAGSSSPEAYIKGIRNPEPIIQHIMRRARIAKESVSSQ